MIKRAVWLPLVWILFTLPVCAQFPQPNGGGLEPGTLPLQLSFASLLELDDGLKSMERAPHRMAMADFTIWPLNPKEKGLGRKMREIFKQTQAEQLAKKWDQTAK